MSIIARKGKLQKTFSDLSWENLGENKNGWEEVVGGETSNITAKAVQPPTGSVEKKEAPVQGATTSNKVEEVKEENNISTSASNETEEEKIAKFVEEKKAEFSAIVKESGLTKNLIKDYFDKEENNIAYKANDGLDVLIGILHDHLNGDIELLKSKFSI